MLPDLGLGPPNISDLSSGSLLRPNTDCSEAVRAKLKSRKIILTESPEEAAAEADVLYTDVWVSMGKRATEMPDRLEAFTPYRINEQLLAKVARPGALVMDCLPAYRGKEITEAVFEAHADTIFDQAENRLHAQKAIVAALNR